MSLARQYNNALKQNVLHFAAWNPITDPYEVGDFGAFRQGVFQKLGNIREFRIDPEARAGGTSAFDYSAAGTRVVRAVGGAEVAAFPAGPVDATLSIEFSGASSVYLKVAKVQQYEMPAVDAVASRLRGRRDPRGRTWKVGWRVVRKVYLAESPVILASSARNTSFTLSARADVLKAVELGQGSLEVAVSASTQDVVKIANGNGPIALDLFRLKLLGGTQLEALPREGTDLDDRWPADVEDDSEDLFE
jgi:hypothetical protein